MAENQEIKTKRDAMLERLRSRQPDVEYNDDEAIFGQINDDYDSYEEELQGYRDRESKISDLFNREPQFAEYTKRVAGGGDPGVELIRIYGDKVLDIINDPLKQEEVAEAHKEFAAKLAKEKEYEDEYMANLSASLESIQAAQTEQGLSDEQIDQAMAWVMAIVKDAMIGKFSPDTITMAIKAQNYEADMEQANREGEVKGLNTRIKEELRKPQRGDGTLSSAGGASVPGRTAPRPELGALDSFNGNSASIFERGGITRSPRRR